MIIEGQIRIPLRYPVADQVADLNADLCVHVVYAKFHYAVQLADLVCNLLQTGLSYVESRHVDIGQTWSQTYSQLAVDHPATCTCRFVTGLRPG